ncbi:hypothetical protein Tco_0335433 [Tanacetum coccineum]
MDDELIWAADRVVALTLGSAITIRETANEFAIKGNHLTLDKGNQFDGRTKTDPHINRFMKFHESDILFKYRDTENESVPPKMFHSPITSLEKQKTAENMLVEVGKFTFPTDFVILEMEEDSKVPLILCDTPFFNTAEAVIRV